MANSKTGFIFYFDNYPALLTLPLELWLTPYQAVTRAGFYDLRLRTQQAEIPPLPPL